MTYIELLDILNEEKTLYVYREQFQKRTRQKQYIIWRYLSAFRKARFWSEKARNTQGVLKYGARFYEIYYMRRKNILSWKSGIEIANHCRLGRRLSICHGGVVINADLGDDCVLHGNNIIGNKGIGKENETPILGNGVDVGAGAVIIGNITVADRCIIGAGAVLTKSVTKKGVTVVGVPAKERV